MTEELKVLRADAARQEAEHSAAQRAALEDAQEGSAAAEVLRESLRKVRADLDATKQRLAAASARYARTVENMARDADRMSAARRVRDDVSRMRQRLEGFKAAQKSPTSSGSSSSGERTEQEL